MTAPVHPQDKVSGFALSKFSECSFHVDRRHEAIGSINIAIGESLRASQPENLVLIMIMISIHPQCSAYGIADGGAAQWDDFYGWSQFAG
jgi:hypothetical protein